MKASRILLVAAVMAYFPIKIYLLETFHPAIWLRIGMVALFWGTVFVVGVISERGFTKPTDSPQNPKDSTQSLKALSRFRMLK
ncbi:MAG TPA: hypothetical protein VNZ47_13565 [Candidatus Dormibacteraeota bacterium]|jgi:hypothetical protein|nr:hypothetical protein [Candidatus Dormibacteraeota bacterium]